MLQLGFWLGHRRRLGFFGPEQIGRRPSYVPASMFVSHVIHTATAGGLPDMTATGDPPSTAMTSATSPAIAQA
jgi:hypothetical protein